MDTFLSILQSHLLYIVIGVVIGVGIVMIIGRPARLRQTYREIVPQFAASRLVSTLKIQRDNDKSLEDVGTKIPPTLLDYKTLSHSLNNLGQLFFDGYQNGKPFNALILGEPGIGKSTLLHQYALDFMDEELDETDPEKTRLPIFLPLREWAKKKQLFNVFLLNYLMQSKEFPRNARDRSLLHYWMNEGKLILLLDGLDEMNKEDAKKCIEALNKFGKETISPFIVSCRIERYETLLSEQSIIEVNETAVMQPPKASLAQKYLNQEGATRFSSSLYQADTNQDRKEIAGTSLILDVLAQSFPDILNQNRKEIAFTPLMLKVLAQTFPDTSDWQHSTLSENLWKIYTRETIKSKEAYYSEKYLSHMWHWLTQLAVYMDERPFFYFRPDNLPNKKSKILYVGSTWLIILLLGGAASLLATFGTFPLWQLLPMIAIIAGFYGYLRKSILTGLFMTVLYILALLFPFVAVAASQEKTRLHKVREVLTTLALIFILPVLLNILVFIGTQMIGMPLWPGFLVAGVAVLLIEGLLWYTFYKLGNLQVLQPIANDSPMMDTFFGFVYLLIVRHVDPLMPDILAPKISVSSMKALTLKIAVGLAIGIIIWLAGHWFWQTNLSLVAILLGISVWFDMGLGVGIQGFLLRFWFCQSKILPWKAGFLDDAVACSLLAQQEDCFKFFHETPMQEYFRNEPSQLHALDGNTSPHENYSPDVQPGVLPDADRGKPLEIFCWYDHEDEEMLNLLQKHLKPFEQGGKFRTRSDTNLIGGALWEEEIREHLENADIILLLISPDFIASDYYHSEEMTRAIQRHDEGSAVVLPILLRPTLWQEAPFAKLIPKDAKPVRQWPSPDDAFNDITKRVNRVVSDLLMLHH